MIVRVLGSAAGGGVPQWNCACPNCAAVRRGERPARSQSSFAVSSDGDAWWLVNVSPDVAQQIEAYAPLQPRSERGTPIRGMLATDANVDHLGGLAVLRQMGDHAFALYSSATVRAVAATQPAFAPFGRSPHVWTGVNPGERFALDERLEAWSIPVPGTTPGYAGRRRAEDAVTAFAVRDRASGTSVVFAPVFGAVEPALLAALHSADVAFLDGSFWSDDELGDVGVPKPARSLGHAPISGDDGSLAAVRAIAATTRLWYAHVNNTNPILDPASAPARALAEVGVGVAEDGQELRV